MSEVQLSESVANTAEVRGPVTFTLRAENEDSAYRDHEKESSLKNKAEFLCRLGMRMAGCGGESRMVLQYVNNAAKDLGCDKAEIALIREGIFLRLSAGEEHCSEFREISHFGINMSELTALCTLCNDLKEGRLNDLTECTERLEQIRPFSYNKKALVLIESAAGGCFAFLNGGSPMVCLSVLLGGMLLMSIRFLLSGRGFFDTLTFAVSSYFGSLSAVLCSFALGLSQEETLLAGMAVTLLLVPGFPLINGFSDIFKGYVPTGLSRIMIASVLIGSASLGILCAFCTADFISLFIPHAVKLLAFAGF